MLVFRKFLTNIRTAENYALKISLIKSNSSCSLIDIDIACLISKIYKFEEFVYNYYSSNIFQNIKMSRMRLLFAYLLAAFVII